PGKVINYKGFFPGEIFCLANDLLFLTRFRSQRARMAAFFGFHADYRYPLMPATLTENFALLADPARRTDFVSFLQNLVDNPAQSGAIQVPGFLDQVTGLPTELGIQVSRTNGTYAVRAQTPARANLAGLGFDIPDFQFDVDLAGAVSNTRFQGSLLDPLQVANRAFSLDLTFNPDNTYTLSTGALPGLSLGGFSLQISQFSLGFNQSGLLPATVNVQGSLQVPGFGPNRDVRVTRQDGAYRVEFLTAGPLALAARSYGLDVTQLVLVLDHTGLQSADLAGNLRLDGFQDDGGSPVPIAFAYAYDQATQTHTFSSSTPATGLIGDFRLRIDSLSVTVVNGQPQSATGAGAFGIPGFETEGGRPAADQFRLQLRRRDRHAQLQFLDDGYGPDRGFSHPDSQLWADGDGRAGDGRYGGRSHRHPWPGRP
ncbi:MAG: hypothetical protein D6722_05920, partial [Bacteroidetes bacterium]